MISGRNSEDYSPIAWVGRVPIYAATLMVIVHVCTMIGTAIAMSITGAPAAVMSPWLQPLVFSSASVLRDYTVWQFVTYAFVNQPSINFAIEMLLLYSFGREIERLLGRAAFLWLYATLLLVAPVALTLLGLAHVPTSALVGAGAVHFAVFIAFVMIYPDAELMFFRIKFKWLAVVLLGVYTLVYLAGRAWTDLGVIWLETACAVLMMRRAGVSTAQFESWLPAQRDDDYEELPRRRVRAIKDKEPEPSLHESIDPLLEKISKHGIGSLTKQERLRLEKARDTLLEQEKHSHR